MLKEKKVNFYLSDIGYGHLVRESAIYEALAKIAPIKAKVITKKHIEAAKRFFPSDQNIEFIEQYNNITWDKKDNGSPDSVLISKHFENYISNSNEYIKKHASQVEDCDFVISDFVYEAFEMAKIKNKPSFGICHFPWDWFFSKIYPPAISRKTIHYMMDLSKNATKIFFPPFTPQEVKDYYKNAIEVPFILRSNINKVTISDNRFKILIIDSGSGLLSNVIKRFLTSIENIILPYDIYITDNFSIQHDNIKLINKKSLLSDYIGTMDLVIGRAGFNTMSECIGLRTPMLLLGEANNPEMIENIMEISKVGLGSFIAIEDFELNFKEFIDEFLSHQYHELKKNMKNHTYETNGADIIAKHIADQIL